MVASRLVVALYRERSDRLHPANVRSGVVQAVDDGPGVAVRPVENRAGREDPRADRSSRSDALGLPEDASQGFVRVSLGWNSKPDDADAFIKAWTAAYARAALPSKKMPEEAVG